MPLLKFSRVLSFTSEDPNHPADNLLSLHTFRKWKIAQSECGKQASVTLMLEKLSTITALDIGNDGSAFVEVLAARDDDNFQVLLPTSSFMSPLEARSGTDTNRVRMFTSRNLNKNTAAQKWTRIKVVCSQPFNKHSPFGLTFVALTSDEQPTTQKGNEADRASTSTSLSRDPTCDVAAPQHPNISIGAFFAKRRKLEGHQNELASNSTDISSSGSNNNSSSSCNNNKSNNNDNSSRKKPSNRSDAGNSAAAADASVVQGSRSKGEGNGRSGDRSAHPRPTARPALPSPSPASPAPRRPSNGHSKASSSAVKEGACLSKATSAAPPTDEASPSAGAAQSRRCCLRGVIYTMSGYQNPQRSQLRDKMTAMGASYRPDWTDDCTHLICAFTNTPKFRAVQGKGRIVTHRWIEECYLFKKKMPWEKYMLDRDRGSRPPSPGVPGPARGAGTNPGVCSESPRHVKERGKDERKLVKDEVKEEEEGNFELEDEENSNYGEDTDNEDTDDEIQRSLNPRRDEAQNQQGTGPGRSTPGTLSPPLEQKRHPPPVDSLSTGDSSACSDAYLTDTDEDLGCRSPTLAHQKIDVSQLKFIALPDLFSGEYFFLHRSCQDSDSLRRYIIAFNGLVSDYMNNSVKFVVAEADWDQSFTEVTQEHGSVRFVKPSWIWRCVDTASRVSLEPHVIAPP